MTRFIVDSNGAVEDTEATPATEYVYRIVDRNYCPVAVGGYTPKAYTDRSIARRHATRLGNDDARWSYTRHAPYRVQRAAVVWEDA